MNNTINIKKMRGTHVAILLGMALGSISIASAQTVATSTATATSASSSSTVSIHIMKHLCSPSIKNIEDFQALELGRSPVAALANTVLNCPTTGLPQDAAVTGTVASPRMNYDFLVRGENSGTQRMTTDGVFGQHKLCESDINVDVDGNGSVATSTCLDTSHYHMPAITNTLGVVRVRESNSPAGFHFGTVRFTPPAVDGNNDAMSLRGIDPTNGTIILDPMNDTDRTIMLHVYNFHNQTGTTAGNGTSTPLTSCAIDTTMTLGSQGANVLCVQQYLISKGYLVIPHATGYYGNLTKKAIKQWQKEQKIKSTGDFDNDSLMLFNQ